MRFAGGTGAAPGLILWQHRLGDSNVDVFAASARSFYGDELVQVRIGRVPHQLGGRPSRRTELERVTPWGLNHDGLGRWFAYYEVRNRNLRSGRLVDVEGGTHGFDLREESFEAVGGLQLGASTVVALRAGSFDIEATAPDLSTAATASLDPAELEHEYFRTEAALAVDTRDDPADPTDGLFLEAAWEHYHDAAEAGFGFDRLRLDARHYQPLGNERHVLAMRGFGVLDSTDNDDVVPVVLQRTLGGSETLRGFQGFRFRGTRVLALSAEYRFALSRPVELAAFWDGGRAWGGCDALGSGGFRSSYGAGLRLRRSDRAFLRIDVARGFEGTRIHLKLGRSF
jgi:outer membrane translocation and assembly module TamA